MAHEMNCRLLLCIIFFILLSFSTAADDAAVMSKLLTSLSPTPSSWYGIKFCSWGGIKCDSSNRVTTINLASKSLTGYLPSDINQLTQLKTLSLQHNSLSGHLPTLANLALLQEVNLESNLFTSIAIGFFSGLSSLQSFSISNNGNLSPWTLPTDLTDSINLESFQACNASIIGSIPDIFDSFPTLHSLRLSYNNLVGSIPQDLTSIPSLQLFDVSNNNLSGPIPKFPKTVNFSHEGNQFLGQNIPNVPIGGSGGNSPAFAKGSYVFSIALLVLIALILITRSVMCASFICCAKKRRGDVENPLIGIELVQSSDCKTVKISFHVLQRATNNFSANNVLGRGGFGDVYRGHLDDGTKIAVKKMKSGVMGTRGDDEFHAEIEALTKLRHRHLVALLGYCIKGNERLLVYEYMPQGTLSQHLFTRGGDQTHSLNWKQRVSIALDVAKGLEYLHTLARSSFIHRDLKPANILLDDDMRAKIADFGLVKNAPDGGHSVEIYPMAGTFGYMAPEAGSGIVTVKEDVYAFGVVLMELITGKKAVHSTMSNETRHLATWFKGVLRSEAIIREIDQTLQGENRETVDSILEVAKLAGHCTADKPYRRPDMGHVVNILRPLVQQWSYSSTGEGDENGNMSPSPYKTASSGCDIL